jgi:osmotically-inducible protein OsmY
MSAVRIATGSVFDRPDGQIREEIVRDVLPQVLGTVPEDCEVTVHDGVVTLAGLLDGEADCRGVADAIRHVQGVVAVRDRLSY